MELASDFKALVSGIEPGSTHVSNAKAAHEKVRDQLRTDKDSKEAHKDTFLSGSYARSTAINDIKDVDVICVLDIDHTITEAARVLAWLQGILNKHYKEVRPQGRSVGVNASNNVWLDIVPSTPVWADDGPLWIPDREVKAWVQTHPKGQISAEVEKNKGTSGYYVQIVKLMKSWRDRLTTESCKPKSYILETLVHGSIGYPSSHAAGVVNALEGIENRYGSDRNTTIVPSIPDPGYVPVNVAKRWTSSEFKDFMAQVKSAAIIARKALSHENEAESRKLWRQLFGSQFGQ